MNWSDAPAAPQVSPWQLGELRSIIVVPTPADENDANAAHAAREAAIRECEARFAAEIARLKADHERELEAARAAAVADVAGACQVLAVIERDLRAHTAIWTETVRDNVLAVALAAARSIIGSLVDENPQIVSDRVDQCIARLGPVDGPVSVRLNTADAEAIRQTGVIEKLPQINWITDDRVGRGGCVIEAGNRLIDADVEHSLAALYREVSRG